MSEWIEWEGGECPVSGDTEVDVRFRTGSTDSGNRASSWAWDRWDESADIVAYRVVEKVADKMQAAAAMLDAQPVPAEDRMFWDGEKMHSTNPAPVDKVVQPVPAEDLAFWNGEKMQAAVTEQLADSMGGITQYAIGKSPADTTSKPSNPKDAIGDTKVPLAFLSPIAKAHWALAQHCGRVKYGAWNWREAGVRASVYISAIGRHMDGYLSGEQLDPADGTHHLGNVMACCAILLEAEARGNLTDDRPPKLDMRPAYAFVEQAQAALNAKYADRNPKHWALGDTL